MPRSRLPARLAVFGLAPIPLMFELGRLIFDIATADVRQLLRDPKGWKWDATSAPVRYEPHRLERPAVRRAEFRDQRARRGRARRQGARADVSIWSISATGAHNDIVRRPEDVAAFAKLFRKTLDDIKLAHGEDEIVNVFPAVPVSIAVEAGRSCQPKAHPSLNIYDQNWKLDGLTFADRLEHAR